MRSGKRKALGKGLDAIISEKVAGSDKATAAGASDEKSELKSEALTRDELTSDKLNEVLEIAVEGATKNPRVVVWSPKSSAVLRVLKKTVPEFSISKEASRLLEEILQQKYPELWDLVEEHSKT